MRWGFTLIMTQVQTLVSIESWTTSWMSLWDSYELLIQKIQIAISFHVPILYSCLFYSHCLWWWHIFSIVLVYVSTVSDTLLAILLFLQSIWPYKGHYLPSEENFKEFIYFLEENRVNLTDVQVGGYRKKIPSTLYTHSISYFLTLLDPIFYWWCSNLIRCK